MMRTPRVWTLILLCLGSGCFGIRYVAQAAGGEVRLLGRARPMRDVVQDAKTPERTRRLLAEVERIKRFGRSEGLRATSSYRRYAEWPGPAVVWVVSACEPLRFKSRGWSFPVVGEFPYLGWFDRGDADAYAAELGAQGLDVDVRGASAFSTLGWFDDPLISTMLPDGEAALGDVVNVVLHESVHATLHISSEAHFNESLASFVADHLTVRYLAATRGDPSAELNAYELSEADRAARSQRLHQARVALAGVYSAEDPDARKLAMKDEILTALAKDLGLKRRPNNATLVQHGTYRTGISDFERLLRACRYRWPWFLASLASLTKRDFAGTDQQDFSGVIGPLVAKGCPRH